MDLLISGATLVDAEKTGKDTGKFPVLDVLIRKNRIAEIGSSIQADGTEVLDAKGLHLFPGFIDLHTHFREPGFEGRETIVTGAKAALQGGFIASVSMPNTLPPCDHQSVIDNIIRKAKEVPYHIFPAGTISKM